MKTDIINNLINAALTARKNAYCPYSNFAVGAALLSGSSKTYTGFNIEIAAYSATVCAERAALFSALCQGGKNFIAVAVAGGCKGSPLEKIITPCGVCLQALKEFCKDDFLIIAAQSTDEYKLYTLSELLPHAFGL